MVRVSGVVYSHSPWVGHHGVRVGVVYRHSPWVDHHGVRVSGVVYRHSVHSVYAIWT